MQFLDTFIHPSYFYDIFKFCSSKQSPVLLMQATVLFVFLFIRANLWYVYFIKAKLRRGFVLLECFVYPNESVICFCLYKQICDMFLFLQANLWYVFVHSSKSVICFCSSKQICDVFLFIKSNLWYFDVLWYDFVH